MIMPILAVKDVDASIAFYTRQLGFKNDFTLPGNDGQNAFAGVSMGSAAFGLSRVADLEHRGHGVAFMVYVPQETDLDAYYADVQSRHTKIVEAIQTQYWGDRNFTVHDPDGYVVMLSKTVKQVPLEELQAGMRSESTPA